MLYGVGGFLIHFYLETSAIREEFLRAQGFMFAVAGMILDNPLVKVANNVQIACWWERERERDEILMSFYFTSFQCCKGILVNNCDCLQQGYGQADNLTSIIQLFVALDKPQN